MRKLRIGVIDLVTKAPTRALFARVMNANLASIMPQIIALWCEEEGHDVNFVCYTGFENLLEELPDKVDLVFIGAFTQAAQLAYALSNQFQQKGAITVLGGPHARCYPQDAQKYFDYVLGFTDIDQRGLEGLELLLNGVLRGQQGWQQTLRDAKGDLLFGPWTTQTEPIDGFDLVLTIDSVVQQAAEETLAWGVKKYHAKGGSVIVMDPA
ncbi:MAG: hypothetical protein AAB354_16340, partial [candidate division KSB1 bacterium]